MQPFDYLLHHSSLSGKTKCEFTHDVERQVCAGCPLGKRLDWQAKGNGVMTGKKILTSGLAQTIYLRA